jgi:hypothetical protein
MAFYSLTKTTTTVAQPVTNLLAASVNQEELQNEINSAEYVSVQDIVDGGGGGDLNNGPLGDFGQNGGMGEFDLGGAGDVAGSIGGIPMPSGIDSAADLAAWADANMDPNRVDTGAGGGDPLRQSQGSRDMPGNITVDGGDGEGFIPGGLGLDVGLKSIVAKATEPSHLHRDSHPLADNPYVVGKPSMGTTSPNVHSKPTNLNELIDDMPRIKYKLQPNPYKSEGEGNGGGGIDGGTMPIFSDEFGGSSGDFQGDLGEIYLNFGIGTSGGEGQANSSLEDFLDAIGGVTPSGAPASEGGQGEGADGNTDGGPVLPPYYIEHQSNLVGAMVDPIPYFI